MPLISSQHQNNHSFVFVFLNVIPICMPPSECFFLSLEPKENVETNVNSLRALSVYSLPNVYLKQKRVLLFGFSLSYSIVLYNHHKIINKHIIKLTVTVVILSSL